MEARCPKCGGFLMKAEYEGRSEVNCQNKRCRATLLVAVKNDKLTVVVLESSERKAS